MYIAEARSFNDGIEFYKEDTVIVANRKNGVVIITKSKHSLLKNTPNHLLQFMYFVFAIIASVFYNSYFNIVNFNIKILISCIFIWLLVLLYYVFSSKNNVQMHKYHAAEHKALNYIDKYNNIPENWMELQKMSPISYRCGSTIIAVVMIFLTISILGIIFIPVLIFKIIWIIPAGFITLYLWANNKCNFFQKFVISEPSHYELEVVFLGLKEYLK